MRQDLSAYRNFKTLQLAEDMRLTAQQMIQIPTPFFSHFRNLFLGLAEGRIFWDEEEPITLPSSIALETDIPTFCRAIFSVIESSYIDDWLTRQAIPTKKNEELEEINGIVVVYIPGEMREFPSADTMENYNENALRYPMEVQSSISHESALP